MKRFLFVVALLLTALVYAFAQNSQWSSQKGYRTQEQDRARASSGTGFAIGLKHIATNFHVVDGAETLLVYFPETKQKHKARVVKVDEEHDLAVVEITDGNFRGFTNIKYGFKRTVENVGVGVFVLGYPLVQFMGTEVKLTTGVISSKTGFYGNESMYQISAPVQPGNSGGPLFNDKGEVIGVVSAKYPAAENVSYAIKFSYLYSLASQIEGVNLAAASQISNLSLSEKCEAIIPNTVMLLVNMEDIELADSRTGTRDNFSASAGNTANNNPKRINRPRIERAVSQSIIIEGIERGDSYLAIHCAYTNTRYNVGGWYNISKEAYIRDTKTGKRYPLIDTENCAVAPRKTSIGYGDTETFVLYFSPIPSTTNKIDMIESEDSSWRFYGISL